MAEDYRASLPPKLSQDRRTASSVGHQPADIRRAGVTSLKTGGMTLRPEPAARPTPIPDPNSQGENGFSPDRVISETEPDAQSEQTMQPELDIDIAAPPVAETTKEPPSSTESESVPEGEAPATGAATKPGYAGLTEETSAHPRGYPSN